MGLIDGVIATRAGWLARREVVEVKFDPQVIAYADLVAKAKAGKCTAPVFARSDEQARAAGKVVGKNAVRNDDAIRYEDKDTRYYLRKTPLRYVPMLEAQAVRANALFAAGQDNNARLGRAATVLSPAQLELLDLVQKYPKAGWQDAVGQPFAAAWKNAAKVRRELTDKKKK